MPILSCCVDDRTLAILQREAEIRGRTPEQLAEAAIENEAIQAERDAPLSHRQLAASRVWQSRDDAAISREPRWWLPWERRYVGDDEIIASPTGDEDPLGDGSDYGITPLAPVNRQEAGE